MRVHAPRMDDERCRYPRAGFRRAWKPRVCLCLEEAAGTRRRKKAAVVAKRASLGREKSATRNTARTDFPKLSKNSETRRWLARSDGTRRRRAACARWAPSVEGGAMNRNRRANAGPVATTGNGTYGQFYQRDASGAYPGDLRTMGVGGVPGRRVPPFTGASPGGASASTAPGRGQPFAATNARVTAPTGTSERTRRTNPNRSRRTPPRDRRVGRALRASPRDPDSTFITRRTHARSRNYVSSADRTPATDFSKQARSTRRRRGANAPSRPSCAPRATPRQMPDRRPPPKRRRR